MQPQITTAGRHGHLTDDHRLVLLALAHFSDDDGRIRPGVVEALEDGRLRLQVEASAAGSMLVVRAGGIAVARVPVGAGLAAAEVTP